MDKKYAHVTLSHALAPVLLCNEHMKVYFISSESTICSHTYLPNEANKFFGTTFCMLFYVVEINIRMVMVNRFEGYEAR
jgi:hypothetical protein